MERTAVKIAGLSREEAIERIKHFKGKFPFDFTPDFLEGQSTEQLQHILFAAELKAK